MFYFHLITLFLSYLIFGTVLFPMYVFGTGIARTLFATELLGGTTVNLAPFGSRAGTCLSQNPQVPLGLL